MNLLPELIQKTVFDERTVNKTGAREGLTLLGCPLKRIVANRISEKSAKQSCRTQKTINTDI